MSGTTTVSESTSPRNQEGRAKKRLQLLRPWLRRSSGTTALIAIAFALAAMLGFASSAQAQTAVALGTADSFAVLAGAGVTNTGPTVVNGDLGTAPNPSVTGFRGGGDYGDRGGGIKPPLISNPPGGRGDCVSHGFRAKIRVYGPDRIQKVAVYVSGELIKRAHSKKFSVWIKGRGLRTGRNTIRVVAVDVDGDRAVAKQRFRRCAQAAPQPDFTG